MMPSDVSNNIQKYALVIFFLIMFGFVVYGYQQVCPNWTPQERAEHADVVFVGKVNGLVRGSRKRKVELDILHVHKGEVDDTLALESKSFMKDKTYLIYANRWQDHWIIKRCGGWKEVAGTSEAKAILQ